MNKISKALIFGFILILIDFITKLFFVNKYVPITDFLYISTVINTGTITGILQNWNLFFIILSLGIIGLLIYTYKKEEKLRTGLNLVIAGAIGNLTSRLIYSGVIDFIYLYPFGTFNLADIFIDLGILICIYKTIR